jgi:hypothetical protein
VIARAAVTLVASLAAAPVALGADAWPAAGHDAANTNRSTAISAQAPALLPGWPRSGLVGSPLVGPGGAVKVVAESETTAILNRDGTRRRTLPLGPLRAIGPDGRHYVWGAPSGPVSAYTPAGHLIWRTPPFLGVGPEASDAELRPAPDGSVYLNGKLGLVALDSSGAVRWRIASSEEDNPGALAVGPDGTVYVGRGPMLVALRPDGGPLWQLPIGASAGRLAVADDGTVIVVRGVTDPEGGEALLAVGRDGGARWSLPAGRGPKGLAIGADGTVYLAEAGDGVLRAIGPDGVVRWTHRGRMASADPVVGGDGTIYVGGFPLVALRPDGSRAWAFPPTGRPLVPQAIGADGTLFATAGPDLAGSALMALAGPSARTRVAPPSPARQRALVAGLRIRPTRFRMTGPVSLCPVPGRGCRPRTPFGATLSFTLKRDGAVSVVIRRTGGRVVTRRSWHTRRGTTWTGLWDAAAYRVLRPGRYSLTVRAASGTARVTAGPIGFTVVRG